jgi:integrase
MPLSLTKYIMEGGERYALLVDENRIPAFYPTLYITSQVRNTNRSTATAEQHLAAIKILTKFCDKENIHLTDRILHRKYMTVGEIDKLHDACREKRPAKRSVIVSMKKGYVAPTQHVKLDTTHIYLSRIASYVEWLAKTLLSSAWLNAETSRQIESFANQIRSRRPSTPGRNVDDVAPRGISEEQELILFEVMRPGHKDNPFDSTVQFRNYLILKMLRLLGPRGGELLNVKIEDFDFSTNLLSIVRRADDPTDSRIDQALVKTRQRVIPVAPSTMAEIRRYIVEFRKYTPNSNRHSYLLVTHKSGPTQGQPLSLSTLQYIFDVIVEEFPHLDITAHDLRHRWNVVYGEEMDKTTRSHAEVEQTRNFLEGWAPGSKQGQHYAARHVRNKAHQASIETQEIFEKKISDHHQKKKD